MRVLLVAIGNPLRGDDGVADVLAARAEAHWGNRVRVLRAVQMLPEWAADLVKADVVCFLDAAVAGASGPDVTLVPLARPATNRPAASHTLAPAAVLDLTARVYGRAPRAYLLALPATCLAFGEGLSPGAVAGVQQGWQVLAAAVASWLADPRR